MTFATLKQRCWSKSNPTAILGNAVAWAAAILAVSALTEPIDGNSMTVTGILIAGWFATHTLIRD